MKIRELSVPDDVYEAYEKLAEEMQGRTGQPVEPKDLIVSVVEQFRRCRPWDRVVVVDSDTRAKLEEMLSGGSLRDGVDLLARVQALADLKIGGISVEWSTAQFRQLQRYAGKTGRTVEQICHDTVQEIGYRFFDHLPNA